MSSSTVSRWPDWEAQCSGASPNIGVESTDTLSFRISRLTSSVWPISAARRSRSPPSAVGSGGGQASQSEQSQRAKSRCQCIGVWAVRWRLAARREATRGAATARPAASGRAEATARSLSFGRHHGAAFCPARQRDCCVSGTHRGRRRGRAWQARTGSRRPRRRGAARGASLARGHARPQSPPGSRHRPS